MEAFRRRMADEGGQAVLVTVAILGSLTATVIYLLSSYVAELGRAHNRTRDSVLMHGIVESMGVQIRRAYDLALVTGGSCTQPAAGVLGQFRLVGAVQLCLPVALTQICVPHPVDTTRLFCADFGLFQARNPQERDVLEARIHPPSRSRMEDLVAGFGVAWTRAMQAAASLGLRNVYAQKSELLYRPPAPPAGTVVNTLAAGSPGVAASIMNCGVNADCLTVRICDTRYACVTNDDYIHQRYAFPR